MTKKNIAVILAAGNGERCGFEIPKQMVKLAGKPIVEHTIAVFEKCTSIDEIIIVTSKSCIHKIEEIVTNSAFAKVKKIIIGGHERYESSLAAINAYKPDADQQDINLIFHDAVRPLVNDRIIRDVILALEYYNAVDVVVPSTDTIISVNPITNTIDAVPDRTTLRNGQTPQGFDYKVISLAYEFALRDPHFKTTDDCGVVLKYLPEEKIFLISGETNNVKLTYNEDLYIIDKFIQLNSKKKIWNTLNTSTLSTLKNKTLVIFGGTSGIGKEMARIANAYQAKVVIASRRTGTDITQIASIKEQLDAVYAEHGRVDYVVNTAAVLVKQPLALMSYEEAMEAVQVNYMGVVNVAIASYNYLKESHGHLLNFTSSSYTYGRAYYSLYSSSKAAVVNFTQALAEEWHTQYVRVNCINPERTDTPMRQRAFGIEPAGTLLSPKDVALFSLSVLLEQTTGNIYDITTSEIININKSGGVLHDLELSISSINME